jgi:hypothetical protein
MLWSKRIDDHQPHPPNTTRPLPGVMQTGYPCSMPVAPAPMYTSPCLDDGYSIVAETVGIIIMISMIGVESTKTNNIITACSYM